MFLKLKIVISIVFLSFFVTGCEENKFGDLFWPDDEDGENADVACGVDNTPVSLKKVGFWSDDTLDSAQDKAKDYESIDYNTLTTLNYAFVGASSKGEIDPLSPEHLERFEELMILARQNNSTIKLGFSIGGSDDGNFKAIAKNQTTINTFAKNIVYCLKADKGKCPALISSNLEGKVFDGVDLYWKYPEGHEEAKLFKKMVKTISEHVKAENKYFSITVVSGEDKDLAKGILQDVFQYIDYANVMAFNEDESGELNSEFNDAVEAITYWHDRCLIKNKIVLGVPFYSGGKAKESYMGIVGNDKGRACKDLSDHKDYNGIPTIIKKTEHVKTHAGGIMMRYIQHDALPTTSQTHPTPYSLLDAIDKTMSGTAVTVCD